MAIGTSIMTLKRDRVWRGRYNGRSFSFTTGEYFDFLETGAWVWGVSQFQSLLWLENESNRLRAAQAMGKIEMEATIPEPAWYPDITRPCT